MINTKELRIGNWVNMLYGGFTQVESVDESSINDAYVHGERIWVEATEIKPIPLTPEILLKCGFEKIGGAYFLKMLTIQPDMTVYFEVEGGIGDGHNYFLCDTVKSLHQLQNLYFSLYGNELALSQ